MGEDAAQAEAGHGSGFRFGVGGRGCRRAEAVGAEKLTGHGGADAFGIKRTGGEAFIHIGFESPGEVLEPRVANLKAIEEDGIRGRDAESGGRFGEEIGGEADDERTILFVEAPVAGSPGGNDVDVAMDGKAAVALAVAFAADLDGCAIVDDEEGVGAGGALENAGGIGLEADAQFVGARVGHGENCRTDAAAIPDRCDERESVALGE